MKKAFFMIGTAALLLIGCGQAENVEEGETIALTRPESGNTVSQRITEQLPRVPEEVKELEQGSEEWMAVMKEYWEESTPFWQQVEALMPLQWGEEIPGLGTEEMFAINYGYSYPGTTGIVNNLYGNGKTIKKIGGGGRTSEKFEEEDFQGPTVWMTEDIEMEQIEGVHTKLHGIFVSEGEGELHYWLESPSGEILWDYTKGQGCQQVFSDVDMTEEGTYRMYLQIQSGSPFPSGGEFELYSFTEEANEKADEEYAALLLIGCGRAENVGEGETIALTRPESGNTVSQRITEQLPQVPEKVKELEEGSEEWRMVMDAYAEESTPFWKQVEALMPLQWGEEIPGLGAEEMFATNYGNSYTNSTGMMIDLYGNLKDVRYIGGGGRLSEKFEEEDFQGPMEWITEDIEMEQIEGVHTKLHGIFVSKGEGELHYWLESPSGEILWDYTKGQGCQQVFSDVDMTEEGTYRMYLQIQSGSPFPNWGQFELYSFTEEANEKADEEYAALH